MVEKNIIVFVIGGITYAEVRIDRKLSLKVFLGLIATKFGTAAGRRDYYRFDGNDQHQSIFESSIEAKCLIG